MHNRVYCLLLYIKNILNTGVFEPFKYIQYHSIFPSVSICSNATFLIFISSYLTVVMFCQRILPVLADFETQKWKVDCDQTVSKLCL